MARLTSAARAAIPSSKFAGPGRSFPIENKVHAEKAIQLAPRSRAAGNLTAAQEHAIVMKAHAEMDKS
jgi:hypothetical protein